MVTKSWESAADVANGRRALSTGLRWVSQVLLRWARVLRPSRNRPARPVVLEFYAEAGAPEGALYIDGKLVGHLPGVSRL